MRSPPAAEDADDETVVMIMSGREVKDVRLQMIYMIRPTPRPGSFCSVFLKIRPTPRPPGSFCSVYPF